MFIPAVVPVQKFWIYEIVTLAATVLMTQIAFYLSNRDYYSSTSEEDIQAEVDFVYKYLLLIEIVVWWLALKTVRKLTDRQDGGIFANTLFHHYEREMESVHTEFMITGAVRASLTVYEYLLFGTLSGFIFGVKRCMQSDALSSSTFRLIFYNCNWIVITLLGRVCISLISIVYGFFSYLLPDLLPIGRNLWNRRQWWDLFVLTSLLAILAVLFVIGLVFLTVFIDKPFSINLSSLFPSNSTVLHSMSAE